MRTRHGLLDAEELQTLVQRLGLQLSAAQIPQVLSMIDRSNSGEVDFEEFFSWYAENKDKRRKRPMTFQAFVYLTLPALAAQSTRSSLMNGIS